MTTSAKVFPVTTAEKMAESLAQRFFRFDHPERRGIGFSMMRLDELPTKVTPQYLEGMIFSKSFSMEPNGRTMICRLQMVNDTVYYGFSHVVDAANFKEDLGMEMSYKEAFNQAWAAEGYLLQSLRMIATMNVKTEPAA